MNIVIYIYPSVYGDRIFTDVAKAFQNSLIQKGYQVTIDNKTIDDSKQYIIFGANECINQKIEIPKNSIIVNLEQMEEGSFWVNDTYLNLLRTHEVWDYSNLNIDFLSKKAVINIKKVEIGYSESLEVNNTNISQDIDVLFFGSTNERRLTIRNMLLQHPKLKGKNIFFGFGLFGEERDNFIKRSKVVLNVHYYESKILEVIRLSHLLANKKCVVSERSIEKEVDEKWSEGVIFSDYHQIVDKVVELLENEELISQQEEKAYQFMIKNPQDLPL